MKLFNKFLLALLSISIIPLIIYSMIIINSTGITLKTVIDQNNINLTGDITREVNKYFYMLEGKLDIAKRIESDKNLSNNRKAGIILSEVLKNKNFLGIILIDEKKEIITGMTSENGTYTMEPDLSLVEITAESGQVEIGGLIIAANKIPYFDYVYPLETFPKEYLYFRVNLQNLLNRINQYLTGDGNAHKRSVMLIDNKGGLISTAADSGNFVEKTELIEFKKALKDRILKKGGIVNTIDQSEGPMWLVVLAEAEKTAYASLRKISTTAVILIIVTFCFAFWAAFILAKNLSKPIKMLISGIEKVSNGNLDYKVENVSKDELSKVVDIFNAMTVKLKKLQEDAKASERLATIGKMAGFMGHEIKNPLAAISNSIFIINRQFSKIPDVSSAALQAVTIVENEVKSIIKIIDDILDFSRTRPPVRSSKDMGGLVKEIIETSRISENIKVELELSETPRVMIDTEEMKQVMRNLINNAADSMSHLEKGVVKVVVASSSLQLPNGIKQAVMIKVSDMGCGIPPENLGQIFEAFFSTKSKGTGLGLSVVKRIIEERHKGVLELSSTVGKGTTFTVKLPVEK